MRGEVSKKFSFLLYMDRVHEKGNLNFFVGFFFHIFLHKLCTFRGFRTPKNTVCARWDWLGHSWIVISFVGDGDPSRVLTRTTPSGLARLTTQPDPPPTTRMTFLAGGRSQPWHRRGRGGLMDERS